MVRELPDDVQWAWVPAFTPRSYNNQHWLPTNSEVTNLDKEYQWAMESIVRFPHNPHQARYADEVREKLSEEQKTLIHEVLNYQVEHGFITFEQYQRWEYYCPLKEVTTPKPDF